MATIPIGRRDSEAVGLEIHRLAERLFPIHRGVTGPGVRETLSILKELVPLEIFEVPSGTQVFDWTVPKEWRLREAFIADADGKRVVDIADSNLHIVNHSDAVRTTMPWSELREHLLTLPDRPDWIPYRSSHFESGWSFCLSQRRFDELEARGEQLYDVVVDAEHIDGSLTYGEVFLPGESEAEVLLSTHVCHPSLANDNLSGIGVATALARQLSGEARRLSYRFLFIPATIGAITWLALHEAELGRIRHGLVVCGVGDGGDVSYKCSRHGDRDIDRAVAHVLGHSGHAHAIRAFSPFGYDERQFGSPGIDLPMGTFMRTPDGEYPQYHTSGDDLALIQPDALADSFTKLRSILDLLDSNQTYINLNPKCEPQLGRRGLYKGFGDAGADVELQHAVQWVLNFSDGEHSLLDIAERSRLPFERLRHAAELLTEAALLADSGPQPQQGGSA